MHKLHIKTGPRKNSVLELYSKRVSIGRGKDNIIILPDESVSRFHAEIVWKKDVFVIKDLKSTNGVFVNGERVTEQALDLNDEIRIGETIIEYVAELTSQKEEHKNKVIMETPDIDLKSYGEEEIESMSATIYFREYQILSAFYKVTKALTALSDFSTILRDSLEVVLAMMKAENGFIFINNEKTGELYPRIAYNLEKKSEIDFARCSETIINTVFQTGKSILSSDAAQDDRFVGAKSIIYENIRSVMCVPLRVHDKILGVLEIDTRKVVGGFTVDDLEILSVIAGHIAECMENARLYSDLKKAHDKLQDIDDIKTKMITLVGHELATPLTIIDQYAVLLKDKLFGDITEKQHKVLEVMCSRVAKLKKIISDVSKVSKSPVSYKNLKSAQEEFEINALISETVSDLQPLIDGRNQNLSMNLKAKDIYVFASREGINEVITNIAVNAIKYTPNGGHIDIKLIDDKDRVKVEVKDNGIGIPQKEHDRIFDGFYNIEDVKHHHSGTIEFKAGGLGLGLTIVKHIVESNNGKVWVDSEEGKGAVFTFTIPKIM